MNALICKSCKASYALDDPRWRCDCGGLLDVSFEARFDLDRIRSRKPTMWRYREAIPILDDSAVVSVDEGFTPLVQVRFGDTPVWLKQDHLFPSGSFKDRGASVLISKVVELGVREVVEDSSGNAGCAVASYCARAGIACTIYVPADTSAAKLAQIEMAGARLERVPGTRQDTSDAVWQAAERVYYASHSWNPFFFHGTKTFAFEVCEQLGWTAPDTLILPAGNGTLLLGAYIGFQELLGAGIVDRLPRLIAVQSARCAPLAQALRAGTSRPVEIAPQPTMAEGIAIANPIRGSEILDAVRATGGQVVVVSEEQIARSLRDLGRRGFYIEPTSAATTAAAAEYAARAAPGEMIVSVLTGHGLKSTEKMLHLLEESSRAS